MITSLSIGRGGLGRFGNMCFTIAGTIGIAVKNGQPYCFPKWKTWDNALFGQPVDDMSEWFVNELPPYVAANYQDIPYHWEYKDYNIPTGSYNIQSHLQDPRYFEHCMPLIRETFRMRGEGEPISAIALHWRAGDYIQDPNAYHPRQSLEYYNKALELLPQDMKVMVFSDDLDGAMKFLPQEERFYYARRDRHYLTDFKLMKQCAHFITANSSFSFMAALLGEHPEKKIIMPKLWFGSSAGLKFEGYPHNAIII